MTETTRPRVTYRRQVPAEQYGSETFELSMDVPDSMDALLTQDEAISNTLALARQLVDGELSHSPNRNVRWSVTPPTPVGAAVDEGNAEDLEDLPL